METRAKFLGYVGGQSPINIVTTDSNSTFHSPHTCSCAHGPSASVLLGRHHRKRAIQGVPTRPVPLRAVSRRGRMGGKWAKGEMILQKVWAERDLINSS